MGPVHPHRRARLKGRLISDAPAVPRVVKASTQPASHQHVHLKQAGSAEHVVESLPHHTLRPQRYLYVRCRRGFCPFDTGR